MSAPDNNLRKQKRRHMGPLVGITAALVFVGVLFLLYLTYMADPDTPDPVAAERDPVRTMPAEGGAVTPMSEPSGPSQIFEPLQPPTD